MKDCGCLILYAHFLALVLSASVAVSDGDADLFCSASPRKLYCDYRRKLVQFVTKDGEDFSSVSSQVLKPGEVRILWLNGLRFSKGTISARTLELFTSLVEFSCNNCSIVAVEEDAFRAQSSTLQSLELSGNKHLNTFEAQQLKALRSYRISGSKLPTFPQIKAPNLQELTIDGSNSFDKLTGAPLSGYAFLDRLTLNALKIKQIVKADLEGLPTRVRRLSITVSGLEVVEEGSFSSLPLLEVLNLSGNKLNASSVRNASTGLASVTRLLLSSSGDFTRLTSAAFDSIQSRIEEIDLTRCPVGSALASSENGVFENMMLLRTLKLRSALLASISQQAFAGLQSLSHLDLSNNSLRLKDGSWQLSFLPQSLTFLDLSDNDMLFSGLNVGTKLFSAAFPVLEKLRLSNCGITSIDSLAFDELYSLKEVDVSRNQLDRFPDALCTGRSKSVSIQKLDISNQTNRNTGRFLPRTACPNLEATSALKLNDLRINTDMLLDAVDFWRSFYSLTDLELSGNRFASLLSASDDRLVRLRAFFALFDQENLLNRLVMDRSELNGVLDLAQFCTAFPHLRELSMNGNELSAVRNTNLRVCANLAELGLRNNAIVTLGTTVTNPVCSLPRLKQIELVGNPFDCTCEFVGFRNAVVQQSYLVGSQRWTLIEGITKIQKCSMNSREIELRSYIPQAQDSCNWRTGGIEFQQCVASKRQLALRSLQKVEANSGGLEAADAELMADLALANQSGADGSASYTGLVASCSILAMFVVLGGYAYVRSNKPMRRRLNGCIGTSNDRELDVMSAAKFDETYPMEASEASSSNSRERRESGSDHKVNGKLNAPLRLVQTSVAPLRQVPDPMERSQSECPASTVLDTRSTPRGSSARVGAGVICGQPAVSDGLIEIDFSNKDEDDQVGTVFKILGTDSYDQDFDELTKPDSKK